MTMRKPGTRTVFIAVFLWATLLPCCLSGQTTNDDLPAMKKKAIELTDRENYVEALPLLEKIVALDPKDHEMHLRLGFALMAQTNVTPDEAEKKSLRIRARESFIKAKETGDHHPVVDAMISSIPADGTEGAPFSQNKQASSLMDEAEAFFSQGKLDEALADYQKALVLDPKLYNAALFSGDVYVHKKEWDQAEFWYQKAIAIDPNKERAYRYSATPFMKQGKYDIARDRYVEAYITEPYNKFSHAGLGQWSDITKTKIGHPAIEIPSTFSVDNKGSANINIDPNTLMNSTDGSSAWIVYGGVRVLWHKEKFAAAFPNEKTYRHTLAEETDALQSVIRAATADKKLKKLSPSLALLKELDSKGLLESYILLARADEGISADYPAYLAQNRDKLRRYVQDYVLKEWAVPDSKQSAGKQ
ncbi:MAG TPA: tetratricopeptide repeat protein [Candidatus Angelobacter sp.]|nr:tetratricopeptide repeat protein [Candidatus Angelobacter sp.]